MKTGKVLGVCFQQMAEWLFVGNICDDLSVSIELKKRNKEKERNIQNKSPKASRLDFSLTCMNVTLLPCRFPEIRLCK